MLLPRWIAAFGLLIAVALPGPAGVGIRPCTWVKLDRLNGRIQGQVLDFTHNHGADRRIYSPALGACRDLYVYLPPNFDPQQQYPVMLALHGIAQDEQFFVPIFEDLDRAICCGKLPPMIVAAPDGSITGKGSVLYPGSFFINTRAGCFEDFIIQDIWGFLRTNFPIRPERELHVLAGASMGGFGAYNLGFKYPDQFRVLAGVMPPLNMRYADCHGRYFANFDPNCTGLRDRLRPLQPVARYFGVIPIRERRLSLPLFDRDPDAMKKIAAENPVEMLETHNVQPGQYDMYVAYTGRDEFNIDAQVESFLHVARQRGLTVTTSFDPKGHHTPASGLRLLPCMIDWLGTTLRLNEESLKTTAPSPVAGANKPSTP